MLKRGLILFLIVSLALVFTGCLNIHIGDGQMVTGNGEMTSKTVPVEQDVTGLDNMGSIDVVIDPSLDGEAVIEGESNIIDLVAIEQNANGALTVAFKSNVSVSMSKGVTVRIPAINGGDIKSTGSGSIKLVSGEILKGDSFRVSAEGSGDITLTLDTANMEARVGGSGSLNLTAVSEQMRAGIFGSGRILMTGYADSADISVEGSGDFDGFEYALIDASVSGTGSGNINVNVSGSLSGKISGSGNVVYDGDPSVNMTASGSGNVTKK